MFSYVGDTVCDPFSGSGTTMIEAFLNKRQFTGLEIDSGYCDLSVNRLLSIVKNEVING